MGITQAFSIGAAIYRDSPNTFGHEQVEGDRKVLKRVLGLVASQRMLQDSISDARSNEYCDASPGMKHLWDRLQETEDALRELEEQHGEAVKSREYLTNHRR